MKTYDKKVYTILGICLVSIVLLLANACNTKLDNPMPKTSTKNIDHATSVYEVEFDGAKYIVVDTYRGIGVCQKAGEVVWTKEVKD